MIRFSFCILLSSGLAWGQAARVDRDNVFTGFNTFTTGSMRWSERLTATLPAAATVTGRVYLVTDSTSSSLCNSGGGSTVAICRSTGSTYTAIGGAGGGTGITQAVLQSGINTFCIDATGSTTTYTCSLNALASYTVGMFFFFVPLTTNSTISPTININTLGALTIIRGDARSVAAGELVGGISHLLYYNGTNAILLSPLVPISGDGIAFNGFQGTIDTGFIPTLGGSNTYTNTNDFSTGIFRNTIGIGIPSTGCTGAGHVGKLSTRSDTQAVNASLYSCNQTGVGVFTWELVQGASGGGSPVTSTFYPFSPTSSGTAITTLGGANGVYAYQFTVMSPGYALPTGVTTYSYDAGSDVGHWAFAIYDSTKTKVTNSNTTTVTGAGVPSPRTATWAGTVTLTPGKYWFAWSSDSTSTKFYGIGDTANIAGVIGNNTLTGDNLVIASAANVSTGTTTITMPTTLGALTAIAGFPIFPATALK